MPTPICDYEGSHYRDEFWVAERAYEDAAERHALRALLPPRGRRLLEIGAGYGRLADLYGGYDEVYLLDYARTQMEQAREHMATGAGQDRAGTDDNETDHDEHRGSSHGGTSQKNIKGLLI